MAAGINEIVAGDPLVARRAIEDHFDVKLRAWKPS